MRLAQILGFRIQSMRTVLSVLFPVLPHDVRCGKAGQVRLSVRPPPMGPPFIQICQGYLCQPLHGSRRRRTYRLGLPSHDRLPVGRDVPVLSVKLLKESVKEQFLSPFARLDRVLKIAEAAQAVTFALEADGRPPEQGRSAVRAVDRSDSDFPWRDVQPPWFPIPFSQRNLPSV